MSIYYRININIYYQIVEQNFHFTYTMATLLQYITLSVVVYKCYTATVSCDWDNSECRVNCNWREWDSGGLNCLNQILVTL